MNIMNNRDALAVSKRAECVTGGAEIVSDISLWQSVFLKPKLIMCELFCPGFCKSVGSLSQVERKSRCV